MLFSTPIMNIVVEPLFHLFRLDENSAKPQPLLRQSASNHLPTNTRSPADWASLDEAKICSYPADIGDPTRRSLATAGRE